MNNIEKHIDHWIRSARTELLGARSLHRDGFEYLAAYHAELAIEKAPKALVMRHSEDFSPFTHDLLKLSGLSGIDFVDSRLDFYAEAQKFYIEGRYPEFLSDEPSGTEVESLLHRCEEEVECLIAQLRG